VAATDLTREVPFERGRSALLVVDMQNLCALRGRGGDAGGKAPADDDYYSRLEQTVVPNCARLLDAFRARGLEVIYTVIESLTLDGRDRSLDHKLSGYHVPRGSDDARVIEPLAPAADEIVLPKSSSGVFNSTAIEYVLRNIGIDRLAVCGVYTHQCVESAVRDAADRGFLVTVIPDACAADEPEAHAAALRTLAGYARLRSTDEVLADLQAADAA